MPRERVAASSFNVEMTGSGPGACKRRSVLSGQVPRCQETPVIVLRSGAQTAPPCRRVHGVKCAEVKTLQHVYNPWTPLTLGMHGTTVMSSQRCPGESNKGKPPGTLGLPNATLLHYARISWPLGPPRVVWFPGSHTQTGGRREQQRKASSICCSCCCISCSIWQLFFLHHHLSSILNAERLSGPAPLSQHPNLQASECWTHPNNYIRTLPSLPSPPPLFPHS